MRLLFPLILVAASSNAATDPACLQHPGGAFADVECYNGLSNELAAQNQVLTAQILATIPRKNPNRALLLQVERQQAGVRATCELSRAALQGWATADRSSQPAGARYLYFDVAYYRCVYLDLKSRHEFLEDLLESASKAGG